LTIQGPGIAHMIKQGTIQSGSQDLIRCTKPTGNVPGAGVNWVGKSVTGGGAPAGTHITAVVDAGYQVSEDIPVGANKEFEFGMV
jgi:hypothetical protein